MVGLSWDDDDVWSKNEEGLFSESTTDKLENGERTEEPPRQTNKRKQEQAIASSKEARRKEQELS